jgi:hypothetical protein
MEAHIFVIHLFNIGAYLDVEFIQSPKFWRWNAVKSEIGGCFNDHAQKSNVSGSRASKRPGIVLLLVYMHVNLERSHSNDIL